MTTTANIAGYVKPFPTVLRRGDAKPGKMFCVGECQCKKNKKKCKKKKFESIVRIDSIVE